MNIFRDITFNVQISKETFCKYYIQIDNERFLINFPQLLQLREKIKTYTSPNNLNKIINNENFVLLFLADKKHLLFLEVPKLLELKQELDLYFDSF